MNKFGRIYKLIIQTETGGTVTITNPLTLDFQVQMANLASIGTATFKIKNLAEKTRNLIYKDAYTPPYQSIEFYAGYGSSLTLVFKGTVVEASSYRPEGSVDMITQVDCGMGSVGSTNNYISATIGIPTNQLAVIDALIRGMKPLEVGYISPKFSRTYTARPVTLFGDPWKLLKRETGNQCFINNNRVYCITEGEALPSDTLVITASSGLLGSPKRCKNVLELEMVFEPQIQIGRAIEIQSQDNSFMNGLYTVTGIDHFGTISDAVGGRLHTRVSMVLPAVSVKPALNSATSII